jgi:hypothetical protein
VLSPPARSAGLDDPRLRSQIDATLRKRDEILGLATRWWAGAERAIGVRNALADLRQGLAIRSVTPEK